MKPLNIIYIPGKRCPQRDNSQQWMQKNKPKGGNNYHHGQGYCACAAGSGDQRPANTTNCGKQ